MKARNEKDTTDIKLEYRIGINMGDVVKEGDNLLGGGVNIAARLEALAQSGGITISKNVYDLVANKTKYEFNDLGIQKVNHKQIFMNSASPGVISLFLSNSYYSSRNEYLDAIATAMQEEYETIVNAGIQLQLDCPDLALSRHMTFKNESDEDFIKIANHNMEILNESLKNIPSNKLRLHVCWG
ncbi:hypothetical protein N9F60_01890, partial [Alphaproteobacteria bacterium]|nr:hypothetical protein [Alphaproteobacteria bacterium]